MLYYIPEKLKIVVGESDASMNSEDIVPTLLSLCEIPIPDTVEGIDYRPYLEGKEQIGTPLCLVVYSHLDNGTRFSMERGSTGR